MVNLRRMALATEAVTPSIPGTLLKNTGAYTTSASGHRTPAWTSSSGRVQVQALSGKEREQLEGLNINSVVRKVYMDGTWTAEQRQSVSGGDSFLFGGFRWDVVQVIEQWADWAAVAVVQVRPEPKV